MSVLGLGLCFEEDRHLQNNGYLVWVADTQQTGSSDMGHGTVNMSHVRHNKHVTCYNKHVSHMWGQNAGQVSSFWFNCGLTFYKRRDEYISRECPLAASLKCFYTESKYFPSFTDSPQCLQVCDTSELPRGHDASSIERTGGRFLVKGLLTCPAPLIVLGWCWPLARVTSIVMSYVETENRDAF